ncbi:hypothetical protein MVEN_00360100 [Mycena venus]|uniref:Fungal-type protein kinase domain-containing protein n=1 Tax=Mycena venus TaxID=2733690 RepID=A0A8H6YV68_9AGAR|nr:hypothetical protein MVEN_00360100 [Mycena venus]
MERDSDDILCNSGSPMACFSKMTLENACSAVDLLVVVRDVVIVLKKLFFEHQILHRHIDFDTISVREDVDSVKGVVLDLDFPDVKEGSSRSTMGHASCGMFTFHSLKRIRDSYNKEIHEHTIQDDLESVFYALCWACYGYDHTGRPDKFRPDWMNKWMERHAISTAYCNRRLFRSSEIPSHVNRYMGCQRDALESVIEEVRRTLCNISDDPEEACAAFMDILEKGI